MFWCLVSLSTGALCGGLYSNPLEMAIQSASLLVRHTDPLLGAGEGGCVVV